ncbi:hypothetical protein OG592_37545 [Streptomyces avidinii]|uniref:hypothetical protein n=1 Tax=Streptomyces avidinii TaxID=1895 RepID=UPI0038648B66|nr:hypothetical protein OG592_37545 [Streptomyces avidinii]
MDCTKSTLDLTQVANLYAQLSGTLAGFALAAVFIVVSHLLSSAPPAGRREEALSKAIPVLLSALLGLILTALAYCIIAADGKNTGRAIVEHVVAGLAFSVSGAMLIYAAVLLLESVLPHTAVDHGRRLLGQCAPLPMFALLCNGVYEYGKVYYRTVPGWLGLLIAGLLVVLLGASVLGYIAYGRPGLDGVRLTGDATTRGIAGGGLTAVTLCVLMVSYTVSLGGSGCSVPMAGVVAVMVAGFLAAIGLSVWLFLTRPPHPVTPVPAPAPAPAPPGAPGA